MSWWKAEYLFALLNNMLNNIILLFTAVVEKLNQANG
jgi:hypothetical protein